jgi:hypothetical protein
MSAKSSRALVVQKGGREFRMKGLRKELMLAVEARQAPGFLYLTGNNSVNSSTIGIECFTVMAEGTDSNQRIKDQIHPKQLDVAFEWYNNGTLPMISGCVRAIVIECAHTAGAIPVLAEVFPTGTPGVLTPFNPLHVGPKGSQKYRVLYDDVKTIGVINNTSGAAYCSSPVVVVQKASFSLKGNTTYSGQTYNLSDTEGRHYFCILLSDVTANLVCYNESGLTFYNA